MIEHCYLCGGPTPAGAKGKHCKCYNNVPQRMRSKVVEDALKETLSPTYDAQDEIAQRDFEIWTSAMCRQLARLSRENDDDPSTLSSASLLSQHRLAALPAELQVLVASFFDEQSVLAREMRFLHRKELAIVLSHRRLLEPGRETNVVFKLGMTVHTSSVPFGDRTCICDITTQWPAGSKGCSNKSLYLDETSDWQYLIFAVDVSGCHNISLYSEIPPKGPWYRLIPRAWLETSHGAALACRFRGAMLRDVVPTHCQTPLFDSIPNSLAELAWYAEGSAGPSAPPATPRMMCRTLRDVTGITIAYMSEAAIDLHFHSPDTSSKDFYRSFDIAGCGHPIFRHVRLREAEVIVDVAIRVEKFWLGYSSASFLFATSQKRLLDIAPYVEATCEGHYKIDSLMSQPRAITTIYLNKRANGSENSTFAVAAQGPSYTDVPNVEQHLERRAVSHHDRRPGLRCMSLGPMFRDHSTVGDYVLIWEDEDLIDGLAVCKGMRTSNRIFGQWRDDISARLFRLSEGERFFLVNVERARRQGVCWTDDESLVDEDSALVVEAGKAMTWWAFEAGNFVVVD